MAVDRANYTPPLGSNNFGAGRDARLYVARANITPPAQASTGTPVALTSTPFNPGFQT